MQSDTEPADDHSASKESINSPMFVLEKQSSGQKWKHQNHHKPQLQANKFMQQENDEVVERKNTVEASSPKTQERAKGPVKKIRIQTQTIKPGTVDFPKGFARPAPVDKDSEKKQQRKEAFDRSGYRKRFLYDDNWKADTGDRLNVPNQQDFLKMKIKERQSILQDVIQQGQQELQQKKLRNLDEAR